MGQLIVFILGTVVLMRLFSTYISHWAAIIILLPLILVFQSYIILKKSSGDIRPEAISSKSGIRVRVRHLKAAAQKAKLLGFKEYDIFWLKTFTPSIMAIFRHETDPVILSVQHSGARMIFEYITYFEPDVTLTTATHAADFTLPLIPGQYAQVLENSELSALLERHREGVQFFKEHSFTEKQVALNAHKAIYIEVIKRTADNALKMEAGPFKVVWWMIAKRGKIYEKSMREQEASGMVKLG